MATPVRRLIASDRLSMTQARANGIDIEYQENGPADGEVILLIMGLGMQLVAWPDAFCEGLAARGFRVVRFDNRDAGLSSRMRHASLMPTAALMAAAYFGLPVRAPYGLNDMADDALGLIDAIGVRARSCRRRLHGRDDRADPGGRASRSGREPGFDHVEQRPIPACQARRRTSTRALLRRRHRNDPEHAIVEMAHFFA